MAKAIVKDAPILVLDEPTTALDHDSEMKVIDYLKKTKKIVVLTTQRRIEEWNELDVFEI